MDKQTKERIIKKGKWADEKIDKLEKNIVSKTMIRLKKAFNRIKRDVIMSWYRDYGYELKITPGGYHRKLDIFKIPKIIVNKETGEYNYTFSSEEMTKWHRVDHDYIYQNSFIGGWHGGATKLGSSPKPGYDEPHPHPGIPYWRYPSDPYNGELIYEHWSEQPAARSFSPRNRISKLFKEELNSIVKEMQQKFNEEEKAILDELYDYVRSHM